MVYYNKNDGYYKENNDHGIVDRRNDYKHYKTLKAQIEEELIPIAWHSP